MNFKIRSEKKGNEKIKDLVFCVCFSSAILIVHSNERDGKKSGGRFHWFPHEQFVSFSSNDISRKSLLKIIH